MIAGFGSAFVHMYVALVTGVPRTVATVPVGGRGRASAWDPRLAPPLNSMFPFRLIFPRPRMYARRENVSLPDGRPHRNPWGESQLSRPNGDVAQVKKRLNKHNALR